MKQSPKGQFLVVKKSFFIISYLFHSFMLIVKDTQAYPNMRTGAVDFTLGQQWTVFKRLVL
jgi:hypothetical protein